jgi:hypothetical protein
MKRSELYDRIWTIPASKTAEELGISGSRVAAICKRHSIPTPPRGYWAKVAVGKHLPQTPLPQPEADYELKLGAVPPKPSAWVAPGVLLRAEAVVERPQAIQPAPELKQIRPTTPVQREAPQPDQASPGAAAAGVDLELIRAAAAELQSMQAMRDLLHAVTARALRAQPGEARRILTWAATIRRQLDLLDPATALLRINLSVSDNCNKNCCTDSQRLSPTPLSE